MHHILPRSWYHGAGPTAQCCIYCHREFNKLNPMNYVWNVRECFEKWYDFVFHKRQQLLNNLKE